MPYDSIELNLRVSRIPYFDLKNKKYEKQKIKKKLYQFNKYLKTFGLSFKKIQIPRLLHLMILNWKLKKILQLRTKKT